MKQKNINFPVTLPATWKAPTKESLSQISPTLQNWLLDEGSLTARLKKHSCDFRVHVIGEQQALCSDLEADEFIKAGEAVLVREVLLYCDDVPQVFARSLLPLTSLTGQGQSLANLGEQPLGQVLFNNPSLIRKRLELSSFSLKTGVGSLIDTSDSLTENTHNSEVLWGRRSIFILDNKPLMVAEVFLPGAFAYQECDTHSLK